MKLAKIRHAGRIAEAAIEEATARRIGPWSEGDVYAVPFGAPAQDIETLRASADAGDILALDAVDLLPPIGPSSKLVCLGLNYKAHVEETQGGASPHPSLFTRLADSLVGDGAPVIRPRISEQFDFEGEIAIVIGEGGRHIQVEHALDHVFGYTIMMDGSVRDFQKEHSISSGKNFWRSGALGPWIVTRDEIPDPRRLALRTRLNGETVQSTTADLMICDIPSAIAYVSSWTPLSAGDVIATGTPAGVGSRRTPPLWMRDGDRIEVEVSQIGVLSNPVEDEGRAAESEGPRPGGGPCGALREPSQA